MMYRVSENQHKEIIIIDGVDKMPLQHQEGLLTMMERAAFTSTSESSRSARYLHGDLICVKHFPKEILLLYLLAFSHWFATQR
jgi:hypothetical protein